LTNSAFSWKFVTDFQKYNPSYRLEVELPRLKHLWLDAGYRGEGRGWVEKAL
jgi:hypothetical protein